MQQQETTTPEQNFTSSVNYLLDVSPEQAGKLDPIWVNYQKTSKSLQVLFPKDSDGYLNELAKLHQKTINDATPHLNAGQSTRLEEILTERLEWARRSKETAEKMTAQCPPAPISLPPPSEKGKGGGPGGGPAGGGPGGGMGF